LNKIIFVLAVILSFVSCRRIREISFEQEIFALIAGEDLTINLIIEPENAITGVLSWESGNEAIAAIDEDGTLKALVSGQTILTVTTAKQKKTTSCIVRVYPETMRRINGGTFAMGSEIFEHGRIYNEVRRQVTVNGFFMGKYLVTQEQYLEMTGTNPSNFEGSNLPVESLNWYDAIVFCNMLSIKEGLDPVYSISGNTDPSQWGAVPEYYSENNIKALWDNVEMDLNAGGYRLPTEAEWEYACRAGTTTPFNTGNNVTIFQANYDGNHPYLDNEKGTYLRKPVEVGTYDPNPWGLFDIHGNLWEWCWDWYEEYADDPALNPLGASSGVLRVLRGGSWNDSAQGLRSAYRGYSPPSARIFTLGLRLVRS
jgi:formylglycine-generating enzyme required for sulfatase activity